MKNIFKEPRIVISMGDEKIIAFPFNIPDEAPIAAAAKDQTAEDAIMEMIARYPKARVTLLLDNMEQDYAIEEIPPLNFFDRQKLIKRKLKLCFPDAKMTAHFELAHDGNKILMIGLSKRNHAFAWEEKLKERHADICFLPEIGARMVGIILNRATTDWKILITRNMTGGFRQIITYKNDLALTRLTHLPDTEEDNIAHIIANDIKSSLEYLSRHGLQSPQDISAMIFLPDNIHNHPAISKLNLHTVESISPSSAACHLSLSRSPSEGDVHSDLIFAEYLSNIFALKVPLMMPETKKLWARKKLKIWGYRLSVILLIFSLSLTASKMIRLSMLSYQNAQASAQLKEAQNALLKEQKSATHLTYPVNKMRQAIERRDLFKTKSQALWSAISAIATAKSDAINIYSLKWTKEENHAKDEFILTIDIKNGEELNDKSDVIELFETTAQDLSSALPDYEMQIIKTPFPALPSDKISMEQGSATTPSSGEILFTRKTK